MAGISCSARSWTLAISSTRRRRPAQSQAGQQARPGWIFAGRADHQEPHVLFCRFREGCKLQRVQRSCYRTDPGGAARRLFGGGESYLRPDRARVSESVRDPRPQVQCTTGQGANVIPPSELDPIGLAVLNLYPTAQQRERVQQLQLHDASESRPDYQFDIKIDHQINDRNRISGRYSRGWNNYTTPLTLGDGFDNDGIESGVTVAQNASLEYTWTINPRIVWTSHVGVDRVHELSVPSIPTISSFNASLPAGVQGLPSVFQTANGIDKMPTFLMQGKFALDESLRSVLHQHYLCPHPGQLLHAVGDFQRGASDQSRRRAENFLQQFLAAELPDRLHDLYRSDTTSPTPNSNTDASGNHDRQSLRQPGFWLRR